MKPLNFIPKVVWAVLSGFVLSTLAAASFLVAPAGVTYADGGAPRPGAAPTRAANFNEHLHNWYLREQTWLSVQQTHLNRAGDIATKIQAYITHQKGKGKDTSALEAALATFQQQVGTAQSAHDVAAGILSTHAGFDANGQVTDADQAYQTIKSTLQSLRDAHVDLKQAAVDLHNAFRQWREANK